MMASEADAWDGSERMGGKGDLYPTKIINVAIVRPLGREGRQSPCFPLLCGLKTLLRAK